jgi:AraC-like DNA-binding protein
MTRPNRPAKINTFSFGFRGGSGILHRMESADQHNEIELNYIGHGQMILQHGAREVAVNAGELLIYWAAIPHQVTLVKRQTAFSWLSLPLSWFLSWNLSSPLWRQILNGEMIRLPKKKSPALPEAAMLRWTDDLQKKSPEIDTIVELELEVYFRRLDLACDRPGASGSFRKSQVTLQKDQYGHVQKMVRFMTSRFREPITVPQVAAAAELNTEYAMRLFRRCWGMTIGEFLRQQRIWHAQRLLALGEAKIVDIAFACGFGSASRFYAAFQEQCHCTPRDYRRRA